MKGKIIMRKKFLQAFFIIATVSFAPGLKTASAGDCDRNKKNQGGCLCRCEFVRQDHEKECNQKYPQSSNFGMNYTCKTQGTDEWFKCKMACPVWKVWD